MSAPPSAPTASAGPPPTLAEDPARAGGGVQPFAILLVLSDDLTIAQCSANAPRPWNTPGRPLAAILSPRAMEAIRCAAEDPRQDAPEDLGPLEPRDPAATSLHGFLHRGDRGQPILELLPAGDADRLEADRLIRHAASAIAPGESIAAYGLEIVERLRAATGYDRALLCRLDPDGIVVAEAFREGLAPTLGLRIPSPALAPRRPGAGASRRVEIVADATAEPVPLTPPAATRHQGLGSALAAPAPEGYRIALACLGARAALVAPVFVEGEPWGILACHHEGPRAPSPAAIRLLETIAPLVGAQAAVAGPRDRAGPRKGLGEGTMYGILFSQIEDAVVVADFDGRIHFWNEGASRLFGWGREEMIGRTLDELLSESARADATDWGAAPLAAGATRGEYPVRRKGGETAWVDARMQLLREGDEYPAGILGIFRDVTERRRMEERLRDSEARFHTFMDHMPVFAWIKDDRGRCVFINRHSTVRSGQGPEAFLGKTVFEFCPPELAAAYHAKDREVIETGRPLEVEEPYILPDGTLRRRLAVKFPLSDARGRRFTGGVAIDITERVTAEARLRESESRYALAVAGSNDGIWEWHPATGTDYLSPRWKQLLGYAEDELLDHEDSFFNRLHPDDQDRIREEHRRHFANRTPYRTELRLRHRNGGYRWFLSCGQAEWDENGNPTRMAGSIADITEARQARARLEEALRFNEKIISTSAVILYIYDPHSRRAWLLNRSLAASLGWDQSDLEDKGWDFLTSRLHPEDAARRPEQEELLRGAPDGTVAQAEWRLRADDGQWRWFLARQTVLERQEDGSPRTLLGMMLDVTERKRAEGAVLASLAEKETLLREIHHRVKNNLAVIVGLLGMQARRVEDPASREVLRESRNRIHSMASVHEMLYQSRQFSAIDLAPYVQQLGGMLLSSYDVSPGRIAFEADVAPVLLDLNTAIPFGLILNELISNALKHAFPDGRPGRIAVSIAPEPSGIIALCVSDDGAGVPPGLDFQQSRSLGLRLVRSLTDQINGTLTLESDGEGAAFLIRFPARCGGDHRR